MDKLIKLAPSYASRTPFSAACSFRTKALISAKGKAQGRNGCRPEEGSDLNRKRKHVWVNRWPPRHRGTAGTE